MVSSPDWPAYQVAATGGAFQITLEDSERGLDNPTGNFVAQWRETAEGIALPHTLAAVGGFKHNGISYEFTYPLGYDGRAWRLDEREFHGYRGKYRRSDFQRSDGGDPGSRAGSQYFEEVVVPALAAWIAAHQDDVHRAENVRRRHRVAQLRASIREQAARHAKAQAARRADIAALQQPLVATIPPPPPWTVDLVEHVGTGDVIEVYRHRPLSRDTRSPDSTEDAKRVTLQRAQEGDGERVEVVAAGVQPGDTIFLNTMPAEAHAIWQQMIGPHKAAVASWEARLEAAYEKGEPFDEPFPSLPAGALCAVRRRSSYGLPGALAGLAAGVARAVLGFVGPAASGLGASGVALALLGGAGGPVPEVVWLVGVGMSLPLGAGVVALVGRAACSGRVGVGVP